MSALGQKQTFRDVQTRSAFTSESGHYSAAVFHKNFAGWSVCTAPNARGAGLTTVD